MSLAVSLDAALQEKVRQIAELQRSSFNNIVSQALREYIELEEKKIAFQQEAMTAWQSFQQDGLHLTDDEVARAVAYMANQSGGNFTEPPVKKAEETAPAQ